MCAFVCLVMSDCTSTMAYVGVCVHVQLCLTLLAGAVAYGSVRVCVCVCVCDQSCLTSAPEQWRMVVFVCMFMLSPV